MFNLDTPCCIDEQVILMKKYVAFTKKIRIKRLLNYAGYFRLSRYGKYLLSFTNVLQSKPSQDILFLVYEFDVELRKLLFSYCKKAEIQFKSILTNAVALKLNNAIFYLDDNYYTKSCSERDRKKRNSNINFYPKFKKMIVDTERKLRSNINKYPEFKEYRTGGTRVRKKIPSWAAFSYFEFGLITNIYKYLRGDLRKSVLTYGYSKKKYGKETTKQMDTWLDAIRNLRNICAHHNRLVGKTSSVVLLDNADDISVLPSDTDLFSRIYALKKVLNSKDSQKFKIELQKIIKKSKLDIYQIDILPRNWEVLFDRINYL
ncbi:Abi family protein [Vallitalea guaymasensis]|uniref:Abi family protein n=1 Tax=Vallitalea guaymasensis TaxID=1185412 RepID=UPI002355EB86|nr:Abi family protein [Vallitalea guaymasensis]